MTWPKQQVHTEDDAQSTTSNTTIRSLNSQTTKIVRPPNNMDQILDRISRLIDEKYKAHERAIQQNINLAIEEERLRNEIFDSQLRGASTKNSSSTSERPGSDLDVIRPHPGNEAKGSSRTETDTKSHCKKRYKSSV